MKRVRYGTLCYKCIVTISWEILLLVIWVLNCIIYHNILWMAMFLLNIQLHIQRIHLGKGRMATQLVPLMQMELLHLLPTSSCRGCILFSMLCQIQTHHAAVACILAIIKSWALASWHEHLFGSYHSLSKTCIWSTVISKFVSLFRVHILWHVIGRMHLISGVKSCWSIMSHAILHFENCFAEYILVLRYVFNPQV